MKPIRLSQHAQSRALLRGATEAEVAACVEQSPASPAEKGRWSARKTFLFNALSPVNRRLYRFKTVEAIFVEEPLEIVVVTIKVYYSNEEMVV